jgi:hypothetical protein
MTEDPRFIKAWLKMARRIIQISKIESAKQYQKKMMEKYFKWHPPTKTKKKKASRVCHQEQDLKPDLQSEICPSWRAVSGSTIQIR